MLLEEQDALNRANENSSVWGRLSRCKDLPYSSSGDVLFLFRLTSVTSRNAVFVTMGSASQLGDHFPPQEFNMFRFIEQKQGPWTCTSRSASHLYISG